MVRRMIRSIQKNNQTLIWTHALNTCLLKHNYVRDLDFGSAGRIDNLENLPKILDCQYIYLYTAIAGYIQNQLRWHCNLHPTVHNATEDKTERTNLLIKQTFLPVISPVCKHLNIWINKCIQHLSTTTCFSEWKRQRAASHISKIFSDRKHSSTQTTLSATLNLFLLDLCVERAPDELY